MMNVSYNFGQKILLDCLILKLACPEIQNNTENKYMDIYSDDTDKQNAISKLLAIANRKREQILNLS